MKTRHLLRKTFIIGLVVFSLPRLYSQNGFTENKGQWDSNVLFFLQPQADVAVFIEAGAITFNIQLLRHDETPNFENISAKTNHEGVKGHAFRIIFEDADFSNITALRPKPELLNYFLGKNPEKWSTGVKIFNELYIYDAYKNIDLKIISDIGGIKYEFIIHRGGRVKDIAIRYDGLENISLSNGQLILSTSLGEIIEEAPKVIVEDKGSTFVTGCQYQLEANRIKFHLDPSFLNSDKIVIDPRLVFSTYSGSEADNWGFTGTYDEAGNVYSGGIVFNIGYPVSLGAYQQSFGGGCDIGIIKYDSTGTNRIYATYLGGLYADLPHSLIVNTSNELVIFGTTGSPNFPVTPSAYDTSFNGGDAVNYASLNFPLGSDIFIAKFSEDGSQLIASTFIGGSENDGLNFRSRYASMLMTGNDTLYYNYGDGARGEVITDPQDNIYIGSTTFSNDFPITAATFQPSYKGKQEGVVCKFDRTLSYLNWSSYLGGSNDEGIFSIDINSYGDLYVTGGTTSSDFPVTSGAYRTQFNGGSADAFISCISANGVNLKGSTFWGSLSYDQGYFVRIGPDDEVYVFGQTKASDSSMMIDALYGQPNSGQFISKFSPLLDELRWSTVVGKGDGQPNISPTAFMVDVCGRIYYSGWGRIWGNSYVNGNWYLWGTPFGTHGLAVTPDAVQPITDGQDFYIAILSSEAAGLDYATFFGEQHYSGCSFSGHDHVDGGTSRFDPRGNIVQSVCASCGGCQQFPTYPNPGAWSNTNHSTNCNNAIFKIHLKSDIATANFIIPQSGCAPYEVQFQNTSVGLSFLWDFGDTISGAANYSSLKNPSHTYHQAGLYTITLISFLPGSCNSSDTIQKNLLILNDTTMWLDSLVICPNNSVQIGISPSPDTNVCYQWIPDTCLSNPAISNPFAFPQTTTTYMCLVTHPGCTDTLLQTLTVIPFIISAGEDTVSCSKWFTLQGSSESAGTLFHWSSLKNFLDTLNLSPFDSTAFIDLTSYSGNTFYLKAYNSIGCESIDSVKVIYGGASISTSSDRLACYNDTLHLHAYNLYPNNILTWAWQPEAYILTGAHSPDPIVKPDTSTWFFVSASSLYDCQTTDSIYIQVSHILADLSVHPTNCYDTCDGWAKVNPSGGFSPYSILFSNGIEDSVAANLCSGQYWVSIIDSIGCDTLIEFRIDSPSPFFINYELQHVSCHGDSTGFIHLTVMGATPPYEVLWSNGDSGLYLNNLPAGIYTAQIFDANQCDTLLNFSIQQPEAFGVEAEINQVSCFGYSDGSIHLQISGGISPYSVIWNNGMQGASINGLHAGTYTALLTDSLQCDTSMTFILTEPPPFFIQAIVVPVSCPGYHDGSVELLLQGGSQPYFIHWVTGDTSHHLENLPVGFYSVRIIDAHQCIFDTGFIIDEPVPFSIIAEITPVTCKGYADGSIMIEASGGNPPYTLTWSNGATGNFLSNLTGGFYTLTLFDAHSCDTTITFLVPEAHQPLNVSYSSYQPSCWGYQDGAYKILPEGGMPPYSIFWGMDEISDSIGNLPAGIYSFEISDAYKCRVNITDTLSSPTPFMIQSIIHHPSCAFGVPDGSIQLLVSGGTPSYYFHWSTGEQTSLLQYIPAGTYEVDLIDSHQCDTNLSFTLLAPSDFQIIKKISHCSCFGNNDGSIAIEIAGNQSDYQILWGDGSNENIRHNFYAGIYPFRVSDKNDCTKYDTAVIEQPEAIEVIKRVTPVGCESDSDGKIELSIGGGSPPFTVIWLEGFQGEMLYELPKGIYTFQIIDNNNCLVKDTVIVWQKDCCIDIPNVITPNSDGFNDKFVIKGIENFPSNELIIYNRWGKEIIQFKGYKNEWDGRNANGEQVAEGVYYYVLHLTGGRYFQGSITVIR
ncbi:MAG TPA: gliding motility-associated C-terminal domain-containing protein [Bacteroidales bacterium]|nr:gliding motility-associated C-terminal domain-containing protein [Bacteroidales bacterium]